MSKARECVLINAAQHDVTGAQLRGLDLAAQVSMERADVSTETDVLEAPDSHVDLRWLPASVVVAPMMRLTFDGSTWSPSANVNMPTPRCASWLRTRSRFHRASDNTDVQSA
ncbi:MAG: hypothetical protein R3E97_24995 [Candidatus Eisenbacteria bacterium]